MRAYGLQDGQAPPSAPPESCVDPTKLAQAAAERPAARRNLPATRDGGAPASSGARYRTQFTTDRAYLDLLEEARQLLQHVVPNRDLVEVQRRALQALVKGLRARKLGTTERPRPAALGQA